MCDFRCVFIDCFISRDRIPSVMVAYTISLFLFYFPATISSTSSPSRITSPMLSYETENGVKYWHLVKPSEMEEKGKGTGYRMMAEVYLPRLLTMKVKCWNGNLSWLVESPKFCRNLSRIFSHIYTAGQTQKSTLKEQGQEIFKVFL